MTIESSGSEHQVDCYFNNTLLIRKLLSPVVNCIQVAEELQEKTRLPMLTAPPAKSPIQKEVPSGMNDLLNNALRSDNSKMFDPAGEDTVVAMENMNLKRGRRESLYPRLS